MSRSFLVRKLIWRRAGLSVCIQATSFSKLKGIKVTFTVDERGGGLSNIIQAPSASLEILLGFKCLFFNTRCRSCGELINTFMECITDWNYLQMTMTDFRPGPLYFFDQPTGQGHRKRPRMPLEHCFDLANVGVRLATIKSLRAHSDDKYDAKNEDNAHKVQNKPSTTGKPDTWPSINGSLDMGGDERNPEAAAVPADWLDDMDPMDAYKHMAPQLLSELGSVLLQYEGSEEGCIPHGLVNVLNYSWKDLTAGAVYVKPSWKLGVGSGDGGKPRKSKGFMNFDETLRQMAGKRKTKQKPSKVENGSERQPQESNLRKRSSVSHAQKAHVATTISFSISSKTYEEQGWIVQPKEPTHEEPQWTKLCHWVVERLQLARIPIKQTTEQAESGLNKPPILRHYGDAKPHFKHQKKTGGGSGGGGKTWPYPQIPEVNQEDQDSPRQKLHYRINDGSSFLYYPSGFVAVCQSHSGLSCGGFYTNVFSDQLSAVTLASITAVGRGTVTHPLSGTVTAVWDQRGGMTCDPEGAVTKEWTWQIGVKERIVIQVSDQISVRMLSGTCTTLSFKSQNESVQLPLSPLPNITPTKEAACLQTEGAFTSLAAQELSLSKKHQKNQGQTIDTKRVSVRSSEVLQVTREVEKLEGTCLFRRGGGRAGRELKRLQRRICNILDDWLEFYRVSTGIKCPYMERMSDGPMRPRLKREGQSAALPSLHPTTGRSDCSRGLPEEGSAALHVSTRHLPPASDVLLPGSTHKLSWTFSPKKQGKEGREEPLHFTQSGTFRVHSNVRLESVVIPRCSPELRLTAQLPHYTSSSPSTPYPLYSPCPAQLRAVLLGLEGRTHRLCRCSTRTMPVLTDQEYDAFIWGQPPHSEQILVVCVTPLHQTPLAPHIPLLPNEDILELLYERMNKNRTMPCTQSQLDSFRLVRYELSTGKTCPATHNALLQQRHNAAPGMFLMYIRGKLLFADYIFNGYSCSVRDLHKQISKTRGDYRQGQSLPSDYKFSAQVKSPAVGNPPGHQGAQKVPDGRGDISRGTPALLEKGKVPNQKLTQGPVTSSVTLKRDTAHAKKPKRLLLHPHCPYSPH
ncbi:uncharacterized protein LOC112219161 [Oncorhynchus tshawytscha]|uniref:uncharacterized protein LOC112219161 n=1 Tax=Oncorhynchus tshawytscha TaxID=74940 RepID=UPI001C3D63ED|nr:uncharacterized protein LOC112219161 [Oncorhynchus tshawytscha]